MKRFPLRALPLLLASLLTLGLVACDTGDPSDINDDEAAFEIELSGDSEVPPVETDASGRAAFAFNSDSSALTYDVDLADIDDVTQGHIHIGGPDENGPVVVPLFAFNSATDGSGDGPTRSYDDEETAATGEITADDISANDDAGFDGSFEALVEVMESGNAYVNVHTVANPAGEVRGQITGDGNDEEDNGDGDDNGDDGNGGSDG